MKKHIVITGICSIFIITLFLSNYSINVQEEYYYEVISKEEDYEPFDTGEEDYEPFDTEEDFEIL